MGERRSQWYPEQGRNRARESSAQRRAETGQTESEQVRGPEQSRVEMGTGGPGKMGPRGLEKAKERQVVSTQTRMEMGPGMK